MEPILKMSDNVPQNTYEVLPTLLLMTGLLLLFITIVIKYFVMKSKSYHFSTISFITVFLLLSFGLSLSSLNQREENKKLETNYKKVEQQLIQEKQIEEIQFMYGDEYTISHPARIFSCDSETKNGELAYGSIKLQNGEIVQAQAKVKVNKESQQCSYSFSYKSVVQQKI